MNVLKIKVNKVTVQCTLPNSLRLYDKRNYWGTYFLQEKTNEFFEASGCFRLKNAGTLLNLIFDQLKAEEHTDIGSNSLVKDEDIS